MVKAPIVLRSVHHKRSDLRICPKRRHILASCCIAVTVRRGGGRLPTDEPVRRRIARLSRHGTLSMRNADDLG